MLVDGNGGLTMVEYAIDAALSEHRLELVSDHGVVTGIDGLAQGGEGLDQFIPLPWDLRVQRRYRGVI